MQDLVQSGYLRWILNSNTSNTTIHKKQNLHSDHIKESIDCSTLNSALNTTLNSIVFNSTLRELTQHADDRERTNLMYNV